jgi:hypothetical protein
LVGLAQPKLYGDRFSDRDLDDAVRPALRGLMAARRFPPPWSQMAACHILCRRKPNVKAFLAACVGTIVLAAIGVIVLNRVQEPVHRAFATPPYTRVGD